MRYGELQPVRDALVHARMGVLGSLFFALVIIAQGLPNFLLDPCQR